VTCKNYYKLVKEGARDDSDKMKSIVFGSWIKGKNQRIREGSLPLEVDGSYTQKKKENTWP
jgi:hypothetical protein